MAPALTPRITALLWRIASTMPLSRISWNCSVAFPPMRKMHDASWTRFRASSAVVRLSMTWCCANGMSLSANMPCMPSESSSFCVKSSGQALTNTRLSRAVSSSRRISAISSVKRRVGKPLKKPINFAFMVPNITVKCATVCVISSILPLVFPVRSSKLQQRRLTACANHL